MAREGEPLEREGDVYVGGGNYTALTPRKESNSNPYTLIEPSDTYGISYPSYVWFVIT